MRHRAVSGNRGVAMSGTATSSAEPAARWRKALRVSVILRPPLLLCRQFPATLWRVLLRLVTPTLQIV